MDYLEVTPFKLFSSLPLETVRTQSEPITLPKALGRVIGSLCVLTVSKGRDENNLKGVTSK